MRRRIDILTQIAILQEVEKEMKSNPLLTDDEVVALKNKREKALSILKRGRGSFSYGRLPIGEVGVPSVDGDMKIDRVRVLRGFLSFRFVLPPRYREEFVSDSLDAFEDLRRDGHSTPWIFIIMTLHLVSVVWASIRFKMKEFFGDDEAQKETKGD